MKGGLCPSTTLVHGTDQHFLRRTLSVSHMGGAMLPTNHFVSGLLGKGSISYSMAMWASVSLSWLAAKKRPGLVAVSKPWRGR